MNRQDMIDDIRSRVYKNRFTPQELEQECDKYDLDMYDDILFPIGYNTCDRCGAIRDSEIELAWVDSLDYEYGDSKLIKALEQEGQDYCAICYDCVDKLVKKYSRKVLTR